MVWGRKCFKGKNNTWLSLQVMKNLMDIKPCNLWRYPVWMDKTPMYEMPLTFVFGGSIFCVGVMGDGILSLAFCPEINLWMMALTNEAHQFIVLHKCLFWCKHPLQIYPGCSIMWYLHVSIVVWSISLRGGFQLYFGQKRWTSPRLLFWKEWERPSDHSQNTLSEQVNQQWSELIETGWRSAEECGEWGQIWDIPQEWVSE